MEEAQETKGAAWHREPIDRYRVAARIIGNGRVHARGVDRINERVSRCPVVSRGLQPRRAAPPPPAPPPPLLRPPAPFPSRPPGNGESAPLGRQCARGRHAAVAAQGRGGCVRFWSRRIDARCPSSLATSSMSRPGRP